MSKPMARVVVVLVAVSLLALPLFEAKVTGAYSYLISDAWGSGWALAFDVAAVVVCASTGVGAIGCGLVAAG